MNSEGLLIDKLKSDNWGWKTLYNPNRGYKDMIYLNCSVNDKGVIDGEADITSDDYSRMQRVNKLKEGKDKYSQTFLSTLYPDDVIDSVTFENENDDTLNLKQHVFFTSKVNSSGEYNYFSINYFTGLDKNPFVADSRFSDVFFGAKKKYTIVGTFAIPEGYVFDAIPKNMKMTTPDNSIVFSRYLSVEDNQLQFRINLDYDKPQYPADEYPDFQAFNKKLYELLNEQFVYKKK